MMLHSENIMQHDEQHSYFGDIGDKAWPVLKTERRRKDRDFDRGAIVLTNGTDGII